MMQEAIANIFGVYQPIDGCADWSYIGGVLVFCIMLFMALYALCGVFKRK